MNIRKTKLSSGELVCSSSLLALGLFIITYGMRYPLFANGVVGPGMLPMISGVGLLVSACMLLGKEVFRSMRLSSETSVNSEPQALSLSDFSEDDVEAAGKPLTVVGILGMLILAAVGAPFVGLIPMLGVLVFVCVFLFERESLVSALGMAIGTMVISWILFVRLFEVPMPVGTFWQYMGL